MSGLDRQPPRRAHPVVLWGMRGRDAVGTGVLWNGPGLGEEVERWWALGSAEVQGGTKGRVSAEMSGGDMVQGLGFRGEVSVSSYEQHGGHWAIVRS